MSDSHGMRKIAGAFAACVVLMCSGLRASRGVPQAGAADKATPQVSAQQTEVSFVSDDKRFSIRLPGKPRRQDIKTPSVFGPVVLIVYQAPAQNAAYTVGYLDYPKDKIAHISTDKLIAMSTDAVHKRFGKAVVKDEKISYHGFPGRDIIYQVDSPEKIQNDMRFFLVKNRIYTLSVAHLQAGDMKAEISRFMDSFKLLK